MKFALLTVVVVAMSVLIEDTLADPLAELRWKNRVLLVFSAGADNEESREMRESIREHDSDFAHRDMVVGWVYADASGKLAGIDLSAEYSASLRDAAGIADDDFQVLLVGKDGGVKSRYASPPLLEDVFALIDSMPMRRAEMRRRASVSAN